MKIGKVITEFIVAFILVFVVSAIVSMLWNIIAHGNTVIDWGSSLRLSIVFAGMATWIIERGSKSRQE